jgi:ABC-type multidrug transport system fused ATPase/permease subunit
MKNGFLSYSPSKPGRLRYLTISFILLLLLFPFVERTSFKFTNTSFQQLKDDEIPDIVLESLKSLESQEFTQKDDLLEAVENRIGKEQTDQYAKFILKRALKYGGIGQIILNILMSAIFAFGIYAVSYKRKTVIIGLTLGLPWFILSWIDLLIAPLSSLSLILALLSTVSIILFMAFTAIVILLFVLKASQVDEDLLYGAIAIYMLIGGTWAMIYAILEEIHFGSFAIAAAHDLDGVVTWFDLLFYSFATLTTLGYGDIVPVTSPARSLAVIEAIIGVMYLAIIISRLVGIFIATASSKQ